MAFRLIPEKQKLALNKKASKKKPGKRKATKKKAAPKKAPKKKPAKIKAAKKKAASKEVAKKKAVKEREATKKKSKRRTPIRKNTSGRKVSLTASTNKIIAELKGRKLKFTPELRKAIGVALRAHSYRVSSGQRVFSEHDATHLSPSSFLYGLGVVDSRIKIAADQSRGNWAGFCKSIGMRNAPPELRRPRVADIRISHDVAKILDRLTQQRGVRIFGPLEVSIVLLEYATEPRSGQDLHRRLRAASISPSRMLKELRNIRDKDSPLPRERLSKANKTSPKSGVKAEKLESDLPPENSHTSKVPSSPPEDHINILNQGVDVWNKWRIDNPKIRLDLRASNLRYKDLKEVNLSGADLTGADLDNADLSGADLSGADLSNADLRKTKLLDTNFGKTLLWRANLDTADVRNAIFANADLHEASLHHAEVIDVDFSNANLGGTDFDDSLLVNCDFNNTTMWHKALFKGSRFYDVRGPEEFVKHLKSVAIELTEDEARALVGEPEIPRADVQDEDNVDSTAPLRAEGRIHAVTREAADEELGLQIHEYAQVLDEYFREAQDDDFCFALFGPWGRGKTRLVDEFVRVLKRTSPEPAPGDAAAERDVASVGAPDGTRYEVVQFSAWKYRTTPEVWVHLYETFRQKCMEDGAWASLPRMVRANIERLGPWPLTLQMLAFGVALVPFSQFLLSLVGLLGVTGVLFVWRLQNAGRKSVKDIARDYAAFADHRQKLGLQAMIGDDLKALLKGWIPETATSSDTTIKSKTWNRLRATLDRIGFKTLVSRFGDTWGRIPAFHQRWIPIYGASVFVALIILVPLVWEDFNFFWEFTGEGASPVLTVLRALLLVGWCAIAVSFPLRVFAGGRGTKKILLTVDDLDRCEPSQMLEIIESLKLLLEEEDIQQRVQILMMVEERALENAIVEKFSGIIARRGASPPGTDGDESYDKHQRAEREVIREHVEKLFVTHLRLGPLNEDEIREITRKYVDLLESDDRPPDVEFDDETLEQRQGDDEDADSKDSDSIANDEDVPQIPDKLKDHPADEADVDDEIIVVNLRFTKEEGETLEREIMKMRETAPPDRLTPRALKAFVLRYQLCRLIYQKLIHANPDAAALAGALRAIATGEDLDSDLEPAMRQIVEQVS